MTRPSTVGILAEPFLYEWQVRAIERVRREADVTIPLVVVNSSTEEYDAESWNKKSRLEFDDVRQFFKIAQRERAWAFVLAERTLGRVAGDDQKRWHRHSIENVDCLADAEHVRCSPLTDGNWNELPDDIVDRLAVDCDVVVRFGFGLIRGDVLTAPEYGVVSFHPADIRRYRGMGPPVAFHDGRTRAGSTLQRLDESIDGGEIVAYEDVSISHCHTLWDVFDRLATLQVDLLTTGISNLQDPTFEPAVVPDHRLGEFYSRDLRRSGAFAGRILAKNCSGRLQRRLERSRSSNRIAEYLSRWTN
ncbi:formyltransferase family protein [Natronorubrum daqingense]|uniref:Formyl transferase n=1 Tax=Natronorubrum daqingense TaxID=588898 RepID=A0A1N6ZVA9_9EURY|nr:formyltransferase family protein [Natronorubrum daqingense]APX95232.1 methionyl-tRNA formyltransferase [Natronorubrum daqingense]SIR30763.1 Formyl transferase [Natronorubrum daqingense]